MNKRLLPIIVLIVLAINLLSTSFILLETANFANSDSKTTAQAAGVSQGTVNLCVNQEPTIIFTCNATLTQEKNYYCQLSGTDPDNDSLSYFQIPQDLDDENEPIYIFNLTSNGTINFTPSNGVVGSWSTLICADDNNACSNSHNCVMFSYEVININDAPYLALEIPDQEYPVNSTIYSFLLNDYFKDPDGDALTYTYQTLTSSGFLEVNILANSMVELSSNFCSEHELVFTATDPYNLSADSNEVKIEITCEEPATNDGDSGEGESGAGGGGGSSYFCKSEWSCQPWSECYPAGWRVQVCYDLNGCEDERRYKEECNYPLPYECEENWLCEDWGSCKPNGLQERTCNDLSACKVKNFPPGLERACDYLSSCNDGIKNGDEEGIDCGGSCGACLVTEMPSPLGGKDFTLIMFSIGTVLLLAILTSLFVIYREQIYETMARAGWALAQKRTKKILLNHQEKMIMFESINALEKLDFKEKELSAEEKSSYEELGLLIRKYLSLALNLQFEYDLEEAKERLLKLNLPSDLEFILGFFLAHGLKLENTRINHNEEYFKAILEELRLIVTMTAKFEISEVEHLVVPKKVTPNQSFREEISNRLFNIHTSLQFLQLDVAKKEYLYLTEAYLNLSPENQQKVYPKVRRAYFEIKYVTETLD